MLSQIGNVKCKFCNKQINFYTTHNCNPMMKKTWRFKVGANPMKKIKSKKIKRKIFK